MRSAVTAVTVRSPSSRTLSHVLPVETPAKVRTGRSAGARFLRSSLAASGACLLGHGQVLGQPAYGGSEPAEVGGSAQAQRGRRSLVTAQRLDVTGEQHVAQKLFRLAVAERLVCGLP